MERARSARARHVGGRRVPCQAREVAGRSVRHAAGDAPDRLPAVQRDGAERLRGPRGHGSPVDDTTRDAADARARVRALRPHQRDHGRPRRRPTAGVRLGTALLGVVLMACAGTVAPDGAVIAGATAAGAAAAPAATPVTVIESAYGRLVARTAPGARCTLEVHAGPPRYGDTPPAPIDAAADASGTLTVTYAAPPLPRQTARHVVTCGTGVATP